MMNFATIKGVTLPNGEAKEIKVGNKVLWKKKPTSILGKWHFKETTAGTPYDIYYYDRAEWYFSYKVGDFTTLCDNLFIIGTQDSTGTINTSIYIKFSNDTRGTEIYNERNKNGVLSVTQAVSASYMDIEILDISGVSERKLKELTNFLNKVAVRV